MIENDLLGSLQLATHHIAPYKTGGAERASEIAAEPERFHIDRTQDIKSESRSKTDCLSIANGEWRQMQADACGNLSTVNSPTPA